VIDLCKKYLPLVGARVQTPMSEETLTKEMSPTTDLQKLEMRTIPYRQVVGSLLWLVTGSRVDIAFAVTCCAKYSINPGMANWYAQLRILRYLEETKCYGLVYRRQPRDVEFGCYAERVPDYQLDPQYLYRRKRIGPRTPVFMSMLILIRIMQETWIQGVQFQHVLPLAMVLFFFGNRRCNLL